MRIHIGTDHAGFELKNHLVTYLQEQGHQVFDHGPQTYDALDDYPQFCIDAATAVVEDEAQNKEALGIVIGGSGNGEQIAANKVVGIRAALVWNVEIAKLARQHNNANVMSIGGRQHSLEESKEMIDAFIAEPFSEDERHERRIQQIADYEIKRK